MVNHIHLDLVGGLSGDMFIGAVLDAFPELGEDLQSVIETAGFKNLVRLETTATGDGTLTGTAFRVIADSDAGGHGHRHFSNIRSILTESGLEPDIRNCALGIFQIIAEAEARIHGKSVDDVAFHEVGAWDSIADIVCAAALITRLNVSVWTTSSLPMGSGRVMTAHGPLPIPAPATAMILESFTFIDDGIPGERITPTGAAILRFLDPDQQRPTGRLRRTGLGFGSKRFEGISNVTRLLAFDAASDVDTWNQDEVVQLEFELDDQTAEEIAWAIDRLRLLDGVIDVVQWAVQGKKGRQMTALRLLVVPAEETNVMNACFELTSTLGIRRQQVTRGILPRTGQIRADASGDVRLKSAQRPGGATVKVESDDLANSESLRVHRARRRQLESGDET